MQGSDVDVLIYVQALPVKQRGELVTAALRPAPRRADPHVKDVKWNTYAAEMALLKQSQRLNHSRQSTKGV